MTKEQFADALGIHRKRVYEWEREHAPMPRLMELALEALENRHVANGGLIEGDPGDFRLIEYKKEFYRFPKDRAVPKDATEIEGVHDENGSLFKEYWGLPIVFTFGYLSRHRWTRSASPSNDSQ